MLHTYTPPHYCIGFGSVKAGTYKPPPHLPVLLLQPLVRLLCVRQLLPHQAQLLLRTGQARLGAAGPLRGRLGGAVQ